MSSVDPFKSTSYQVGRILNAITSDAAGNLILADVPNPEGVTLTQLLSGLIGANISFENSGTFFTNATNVQDALAFLNQSAYVKDTGRFIYVDPTISPDKIVEGSIYSSLNDAISWTSSALFNGYNSFNIFLMGSHKTQGTLEQTTDLGVFEFDGTSYSTISLKKNGIRLIGLGNPVVRLKNFAGTVSSRLHLFEVDADGVNDNISVTIQDVAFQFVNCQYTSAIKVLNAPINTLLKDRSGLKIINPTVSFTEGTNDNNRLVDISTTGTQYKSIIIVDGIGIGTITDVVSSLNEIELFYLDHDADTTLIVNGLNFGLAEQPNSASSVLSTDVTSFTALKALSGKALLLNAVLDEKFYWNGVTFPNAVTKLVKTYNTANVSVQNLGIVRNAFNVMAENAEGTTLISDWISINGNSILNVTGFDEVYDTSITSPSTSGISGTDVKPVKSFWNRDEFAFGIGHKNELRIGSVTTADAQDFLNYSLTYGVPFWFNPDVSNFQYFNGTSIQSVGQGSGGKTYNADFSSGLFNPTTYSFPGYGTFTGMYVVISHNLDLTNKNTFVIKVTDTANSREIQPQDVIALDADSIRLIMPDDTAVNVTIIGF